MCGELEIINLYGIFYFFEILMCTFVHYQLIRFVQIRVLCTLQNKLRNTQKPKAYLLFLLSKFSAIDTADASEFSPFLHRPLFSPLHR